MPVDGKTMHGASGLMERKIQEDLVISRDPPTLVSIRQQSITWL